MQMEYLAFNYHSSYEIIANKRKENMKHLRCDYGETEEFMMLHSEEK